MHKQMNMDGIKKVINALNINQNVIQEYIPGNKNTIEKNQLNVSV